MLPTKFFLILPLIAAVTAAPPIIAAGPEVVHPHHLSQSIKPSENGTLRAPPIPNPYPLPHTDLALDFAEPSSPLSVRDTKNCILHANEQLLQHIQEHGGDDRLPFYLTYKFGSVRFSIRAEQRVLRRLTYRDALEILAACAIKLRREGYHRRTAAVLGPRRGLIGNVQVGVDPYTWLSGS